MLGRGLVGVREPDLDGIDKDPRGAGRAQHHRCADGGELVLQRVEADGAGVKEEVQVAAGAVLQM